MPDGPAQGADMNPWIIVLIAGLMETGWALGLKYSEGFTRLWPSVLTVVLALGSFYLLSVAMKTLPVGTAYAVWVGIGAVGTAIAAVFLFQEPVNAMRILGVLLILAGIAALKFA
jgi:quaternary ammonium compound-resistance protein SugE